MYCLCWNPKAEQIIIKPTPYKVKVRGIKGK